MLLLCVGHDEHGSHISHVFLEDGAGFLFDRLHLILGDLLKAGDGQGLNQARHVGHLKLISSLEQLQLSNCIIAVRLDVSAHVVNGQEAGCSEQDWGPSGKPDQFVE